MNILLTGAFGNVGLSTLKELSKKNYNIRIFDIENSKNKKIAKDYEGKVEIIWGDLRNSEDVNKAVSGMDVVLHVAAIIPPIADAQPKFAEEVNVGGTSNIIKAMEMQPQKPRLVYTSSIAIYGDRRKSPLISTSDPPDPTIDDEYAKQKLKCEDLIRSSSLKWVILRLTYIVSPNKLQMDPIMFDMPIDTCIEICDTKDVGLALANTVENNEIWGETLNIAGGQKCRIIYRDYLNRMFKLFGLGTNFLPSEAFSEDDFHCGFMDTEKSQNLLQYQRYTLDDYFKEVKKKVKVSRFFNQSFPLIIRLIAKKHILRQSPYYKSKYE
ncbi:MAG: NAD(P)-dependent oxidoreductase [Candidatus Lokiarchaeota archaeon]|nr:NAD(P)-dependent oxidoreductase [Candidatus Lokiarchaeota archaeon]